MYNTLHVNHYRSKSKVKPQIKSKTRNNEEKKSICLFNQMRIKKEIIYTNRESHKINENKNNILTNLKKNRE